MAKFEYLTIHRVDAVRTTEDGMDCYDESYRFPAKTVEDAVRKYRSAYPGKGVTLTKVEATEEGIYVYVP